jgi:3-dehydroquinate dehydratase II
LARVFVLNGVNLGALGMRRPEVYGTMTLKDLEDLLRERFPEADFEFRQTDHEGEMVGYVREAKASSGIVINPGAWTHYSYAVHDALELAALPAVEVHLSAIEEREEWRRRSVIGELCLARVQGRGVEGYREALGLLRDALAR